MAARGSGARSGEAASAAVPPGSGGSAPRQTVLGNCVRCGSAEELKFCSRCQAVRYCGAECQKTDWANHRASCKPPLSFAKPDYDDDDDGELKYVGGIPLLPGRQLAQKADPVELAALIRTFLAAGGGPSRTIGLKLAANLRLAEIAAASVADARAIIFAEGVLARIELDILTVMEGTGPRGLNALLILRTASQNLNSEICDHIASESGVVQALMLLVARGLASTMGDKREAVTVLSSLACSSSPGAKACARVADALSDTDLRALVAAAAEKCTPPHRFAAPAICFLTWCSFHLSSFHRLVGPAGLPCAMADILVDPTSTEKERKAILSCIKRIIARSRKRGPPLSTWVKPMIKTMCSAIRSSRGELLLYILDLLSDLARDGTLIPSIASSTRKLVSILREGGAPAAYASAVLSYMSTHPGALAAELREGVIPALTSLLYGADGRPTPLVKKLGGEDAAVEAFRSLGFLSLSLDAQRAIPLSSDASARLRGTLLGATMAGLAADDQNPITRPDPSFTLDSIFFFLASNILTVDALVTTGALSQLTRLLTSSTSINALRSLKITLLALLAAEAADLDAVLESLRAGLHAFGPSGVHQQASASLTRTLVPCLYDIVDGRSPARRGMVLAEVIVADAHLLRLCAVVQESPEDAFVNVVEEIEPVYAGRILHYLDRHAGPAVAARLAALVPEAVLLAVRAAADRGRWGRPVDDEPRARPA